MSMDLEREVRETQVTPIAGIWVCHNCRRRIQVITETHHPKLQPFTCVCGAKMEPGEEHAELPEAEGANDKD